MIKIITSKIKNEVISKNKQYYQSKARYIGRKKQYLVDVIV